MHEKHEQLGEFGAIPGAPNGPPALVPQASSLPVSVPEILPGRDAFGTFEIHPAANIFPPMREKEFAAFKADIQKDQCLHEPIWLHEGKVIDGRHRLRACKETGVAPRFQEWDGKGSLLEFVLSRNLHRRHLRETQRAMVAARLKPQFEEEARYRQGHAGRDQGVQTNSPELSTEGQARDQAAKLLSVGSTSVTLACKVLQQGIPELIAAVDASQIAVSTAADLSELPDDEQRRVLTAGRDEIKKALQPIREARKQKQRSATQKPKPAPMDPELEQKLLTHFNNGWVTLTKTERGFQMQFCEYYVDELHRAIGSQYFKPLIEHGVTLIKVEKGVA